jgi:hypothetical protein
MKSRRTGLLLLLLVAALGFGVAAAPALGYVRTVGRKGKPLFWNQRVVPVMVFAKDPPAPFTEEGLVQLMTAAAAGWSRPANRCTALQLVIIPVREASSKTVLDFSNRVTFRRDRWCRDPPDENGNDKCYPPDALAMTSVFQNVNTGQIYDADIEINAANVAWTDVLALPDGGHDLGNAWDLQAAMTHELGHLIGLEHTCWINSPIAGANHLGEPVKPCGPSDVDGATTMFPQIGPGDARFRTLSPDELMAACDIYPPPDKELESAGWSCALAPSQPPSGAPLLLVLALGLLRRRPR